MASGHANRANRPNTWLHRPTCDVKIPLANSEPSTHGTKLPSRRDDRTSATDPKQTSFASESNDHQQPKPREDAHHQIAGVV